VTLVIYDGRRQGLNFAARVRWPAELVQQRLATLARQMQAASVWPQVVVCDGLTQPADLHDHLRTAGWIPVGAERIMWTRHASVVPHLDPGLRIEAVTRATALDVARLEAVSFELDPGEIDESAQLLAAAVESGATRGFLVRLAGEAVASARLMPGEPGSGVASLHAVGVAEHHRRRGYGRLITAIATRAGLATGHRLVWLSVDADNAGAIEMYRDLAFDFAFTWARWAAPAR
jgi:ribosomal protein S18 acetylase RimI-like enzyme